ncbi:MAG: fumarate hydratase [Candidatus Gracilibacteria bacterium]|jgi:fumarate hydratase subunit alpha|nr:fumarate hydratase [Candidatus Gracilibacteria bacterium]
MRKIKAQDIHNLAKKLIREASFILPEEVRSKLDELNKKEQNTLSKKALSEITENYKIAEQESLPLCQDTGCACFFIKMGHQVELEEVLEITLNKATSEAYAEYYLRKSICEKPLFKRVNTGDNTPCFVHIEQVEGDQFEIVFLPKGGGAENKSRFTMLAPSKGVQGVMEFIRETLELAGGSACPPFLVGVGVGGMFDTVGSLAKKAIIRGIGTDNLDSDFAKLEQDIKKDLSSLKMGAMGLGGNETILDLNIEYSPCHIASLPVAVNIQCHSARISKGSL